MATTIQKNNNGKFGSIVAGVASAVAVAGVAVAATIALKDRKTREKVKKTLASIKDQALNYVETIEADKNVKKILPKISRRKFGMPTLKTSAKKIAKKVKKVTK